MKTMQYTIRNVPESVDRKVRAQARKRHESLNKTLFEALSRGIGASDEPVEYHDLDDLGGTWISDPEFDKVLEEFDTVDEDLWT